MVISRVDNAADLDQLALVARVDQCLHSPRPYTSGVKAHPFLEIGWVFRPDKRQRHFNVLRVVVRVLIPGNTAVQIDRALVASVQPGVDTHEIGNDKPRLVISPCFNTAFRES